MIRKTLFAALILLPAIAWSAEEHPGKSVYEQNCQQCHVGQSAKNQELVTQPEFISPIKIIE